MKHSSLLVGLGIGLVVGAVLGVYCAASDEKKAKIADDIKDTVDRAKKKIGEIVDQGLTELEKVTKKEDYEQQL